MATLAGTVPTGYGGGRAQVLLDWLTTVDHKKIGIMYVVAAGVFGLVGGALSLVVRTELIETGAIMGADTYNQMFTMHASIMLFLFIMPVATGFANYVVPLQIGALDMAFPRINALSLWIFLFGGILMLSAFAFDGGAAAAGWTAYPPISSNTAGNIQPAGVGMDLWIVGVIALGVASTAGVASALPRWLQAFHAPRILCAYDADPAGDQAAAALRRHTPRCSRLRPVGAKDWNDLLRRAPPT